MNGPLKLRQTLAASVLTLILAGCGGGDSSPASTPDVEADDASASYVDDVCAAAGRMFAAYQKSFQSNIESLGGMDPTDAYAKTARQPFATLVADLERLKPPATADAAHNDSIRQAKELLDALNRGDRQKLLSLRGTPDTGTWKQVVDLSPALKSQFGEVSLTVRSCQELGTSGAGNPFQ